ncbi:MAG TPA: rRNA maturation RNase YbeY [Candidatus Saccharimonadia bacterium]|nr:rRNA maturation RNase YbeY [Candidatus Saccharimonadia bacterium]
MTIVRVSYGLPRKGVPGAASFRRWSDAALDSRREDAEVSIRITDVAEGRALNLRYRHKDYATNVLSFVAQYPDGVGANLLGDLVICAPVVSREAKDQGKRVEHHWAHLTVHGVLHLLGFDHETVAEARAMEAVERQVLEKLGIPDPYDAR